MGLRVLVSGRLTCGGGAGVYLLFNGASKLQDTGATGTAEGLKNEGIPISGFRV